MSDYQVVGLEFLPTLTNCKEVNGMEAVFIANALAAAGITVTLWQVIRMLKQAGQSGEYETPMDAMNDQKFWVDCVNEEGQR